MMDMFKIKEILSNERDREKKLNSAKAIVQLIDRDEASYLSREVEEWKKEVEFLSMPSKEFTNILNDKRIDYLEASIIKCHFSDKMSLRKLAMIHRYQNHSSIFAIIEKAICKLCDREVDV
jgi:hypothetical protein